MNARLDELSQALGQFHSTEHVGGDQWLDAACNMFPGLSIDSVKGQLGAAWLGARPFADAQILEIASNRPTHVVCAHSPAGYGERYSLGLLVSGNCRTRHAGREVVWEAGDLVLFDNARSFEAVPPADYHLLMWNLPREAVAPMLAEPDRSVGVRIPGDAGPGAILGNFARALAAEAGRCDPVTQRGLLMHLCGFVGLTLGASPTARDARRETHRTVRRQQILTYIEAHLCDPRLSVARAALDLRMSRRWLHALLEEGDVRFSDWVARRRLEECRHLLGNAAYDHLSVADIAFRSGFSSLSTFNRRYRAQYGMAPRDARRRADADVTASRRRRSRSVIRSL